MYGGWVLSDHSLLRHRISSSGNGPDCWTNGLLCCKHARITLQLPCYRLSIVRATAFSFRICRIWPANITTNILLQLWLFTSLNTADFTPSLLGLATTTLPVPQPQQSPTCSFPINRLVGILFGRLKNMSFGFCQTK